MFKSIATFVTNAVDKYKAQRVRDVVTQYICLADAQVVVTMPAVIELYRNSAHTIVDKTFEDPIPAIQLVAALDAVTKHYGPALSAEFKAFSTKIEEQGASPVVTKRIEALFKAIEALTTDVNDH